MLKFSLFQVSVEEENVGIAVTHLESILCNAECSITHWKTLLGYFCNAECSVTHWKPLLGDFETGSKTLKRFFVGEGSGGIEIL